MPKAKDTDAAFDFEGPALKKNWAQLHKGDNEPYPEDEALADAWRLYHAGKFTAAAKAAPDTVAGIRAQSIHANYNDRQPERALKTFRDSMDRALALAGSEPGNPNAHYQYAYAAGRYSQGISVVKALKEGYGGKIRNALETTLKLDPAHAEAHTAMGAYHAEIIDKVGAMVGKLTYGASREKAVEHFERALKLNPGSPIAHIEYANGLLLLYKDRQDDAIKLYVKASKMKPRDAMEQLDVKMAQDELAD